MISFRKWINFVTTFTKWINIIMKFRKWINFIRIFRKLINFCCTSKKWCIFTSVTITFSTFILISVSSADSIFRFPISFITAPGSLSFFIQDCFLVFFQRLLLILISLVVEQARKSLKLFILLFLFHILVVNTYRSNPKGMILWSVLFF